LPYALVEPLAAQRVADLVALQHDSGGWALRELGPWPQWEGSDADCCPNREIRPDTYAHRPTP
jgi:hypothetical protein